jgi:hypothetical protein
LTKLDDLRDFVRNKNKKPEADKDKAKAIPKVEHSLEVAGSEATTNPLASFGDSETDPDLIEQLHSSPKSRPLRGEGVYWDQDY